MLFRAAASLHVDDESDVPERVESSSWNAPPAGSSAHRPSGSRARGDRPAAQAAAERGLRPAGATLRKEAGERCMSRPRRSMPGLRAAGLRGGGRASDSSSLESPRPHCCAGSVCAVSSVGMEVPVSVADAIPVHLEV